MIQNRKIQIIFLTVLFLSSCAVNYPYYKDAEGDNLSTFTIKNVGSWGLVVWGFAEPNGCTGRTWLGKNGLVASHTQETIKLQPEKVFSFMAKSSNSTLTTSGGVLGLSVESCEGEHGGSLRFIPQKNAHYELTVGLISETKQCIFSVQEKTDTGYKSIDSLVVNDAVIPNFATSPMCEKFK